MAAYRQQTNMTKDSKLFIGTFTEEGDSHVSVFFIELS